jgi:hypothetical protein
LESNFERKDGFWGEFVENFDRDGERSGWMGGEEEGHVEE